MEKIELRPAVKAFAEQMELTLRKHDHKTGWRTRPLEALQRLLLLEVEELKVAFDLLEVSEARKETIDVSNYCMILFDRLGMLDQDQNVNALDNKAKP